MKKQLKCCCFFFGSQVELFQEEVVDMNDALFINEPAIKIGEGRDAEFDQKSLNGQKDLNRGEQPCSSESGEVKNMYGPPASPLPRPRPRVRSREEPQAPRETHPPERVSVMPAIDAAKKEPSSPIITTLRKPPTFRPSSLSRTRNRSTYVCSEPRSSGIRITPLKPTLVGGAGDAKGFTLLH
jgi:hypothetical protein